MKRTYVLIHGAWHGGWCWNGVAAGLKKEGCEVLAPTMPGHNPGDDRSGITFDHYTSAIAQTVNSTPGGVILVGHSSAGFMLQAAAPKCADKLAGLVFHNAFILPDGKSQFDLVPPEVAQGMAAAAGESPDNCVPVMKDFIRGSLMAGEPQEVQDALISKLNPQPLALFTAKVRTAEFEALSLPKTVLFCKDDASLPPGVYLDMAQALGEFRLIELAGGHETMITRPEVVATGLLKAAG